MAKEQIKRFISSSSCIVQKGGSSSCSHSSSSASSAGDADSSSNNNKNGSNRCRGAARCPVADAKTDAAALGTSALPLASTAKMTKADVDTKKMGKPQGRKMSLQWTKMKLLKAFQHHQQSQKQTLADATNPTVALSLAKHAVRRKKDTQWKTPKRIETEMESRFNGKENKDVQAVCCIYQTTPAGPSYSFSTLRTGTGWCS